MSKYKYLISILFVILVAIVVNVIRNDSNNFFSSSTMIAATPVFTINPSQEYIDIGQSVTFTLKNNTSKTQTPAWSFSSGYEKYIEITDCPSTSLQASASITCTVRAIAGPANIRIIALINNGTTATQSILNISDKTLFYIDPTFTKLDIDESFTFESYADTSTGPMPIKTNWSVADNGLLDDSYCKSYSTECKITTVSGTAQTEVYAELNGTKLKAKVEISENTHSSAEDQNADNYYIDPEKVIIKQGDKYTFTTYTENGTDPIQTNSEWTLDASELANDNQQVASLIACEDSPRCKVYAGMNAGNAELQASDGSNKATAYIEILDEVSSPFTDDLPLWAKDYILSLYQKGIISGYSDGSFGAGDSVSRGQFITLLYRLVSFAGFDTDTMLENKNCDIYLDITNDNYAYKPICLAWNYGWLGDQFQTSEFKADDPMTREIATDVIYYAVLKTLMDREFQKEYNSSVFEGPNYDSFHEIYMHDADYAYSDLNYMDKYNLPIGAVKAYNVMQGSDGLFRGKDSVNRAEIAVIMWRVLWETKLIGE